MDSDLNDSHDLQDHGKDSNSHNVSDEDINFGKKLSKIQRKRKHKINWGVEGLECKMLADFGEDPVFFSTANL